MGGIAVKISGRSLSEAAQYFGKYCFSENSNIPCGKQDFGAIVDVVGFSKRAIGSVDTGYSYAPALLIPKPLGDKQLEILRNLVKYEVYYKNCGWEVGDHGRTLKLLRRLEYYGLVEYLIYKTATETEPVSFALSLFGKDYCKVE